MRRANMGFVLLFTCLGCQIDGGQSDVKTLDELATGREDLTKSCEGASDTGIVSSVIDMESSVSDEAMIQHAVRTLSAIPEAHLKEFRLLGGKVLIQDEDSPNDREIQCGETAGARTPGCYSFAYDERKKSFDELVILLPADKEVISRNGVRMFGYLYSQLFSRYSLQNGTVVKLKETKGMLGRKEAIAKAYLADAGKGVSTEDLDVDDALGLADFVIAEAFDSFYCSPKTKADMERDFAATASLFGTMAAEMLQHSIHETEESESTGLGLTGFGLAGYEYYPSFGGQTYGSNGGYGPYGRETYVGSYVGSNSYYNVYQNSAGYSYSHSYDYGGGGPSFSSASGATGTPSAPFSASPNWVGD